VRTFKAPSSEELKHDFLWRAAKNLPERGRIGIFNRSHYEEVLVVRVQPDMLERQKLPPRVVNKDIWQRRFKGINDFERHITCNGTLERDEFRFVHILSLPSSVSTVRV
jgi:polyphosphate kinase 2 (PPK2 family)